MKPIRALLLLALLGFASLSHAQVSCPPGMIPYGTAQDQSVCGPDPNAQQGQDQGSQQPAIMWISRWGAIATDGKVGALGTSTGLDSQRQAERAALAQCKAKGGTQCDVDLSYANGCAVMIVGDNTHNSNLGQSIDEATDKAMKVCNANDKNCRVFYTGCSLPRRAQ